MNAETITNPVTGDRMTILQPAYESQGHYAKICFDLPPGAKGSPLHYHTEMDETFTVLKGCLTMEVGQKDNICILQLGESLQVPAGMPPAFFQALINTLVWIARRLQVENSLLKYWTQAEGKLK